jgi:hypothetical protein
MKCASIPNIPTIGLMAIAVLSLSVVAIPQMQYASAIPPTFKTLKFPVEMKNGKIGLAYLFRVSVHNKSLFQPATAVFNKVVVITSSDQRFTVVGTVPLSFFPGNALVCSIPTKDFDTDADSDAGCDVAAVASISALTLTYTYTLSPITQS